MGPRFYLVLAALAVSGSALPVLAQESSPGFAAHGLIVRDASTVLERHCSRDDSGTMWFTLPSGQRFELITTTLHPEIANPGDGRFHPFDAAEVEAAIRALAFPLADLSVEIYILPYPRRGALSSAAGQGLILLAPGVRLLAREHQHAELVHELGHTIQYALMPDSDLERWSTYRTLRGITDSRIYAQDARHENRPHEIFAEDFRVLFGGALAAGSGTIENPALIPPRHIPGLREFIAGLAVSMVRAERLIVSPNPARGPVQLSQRGGPVVPLDLFDVRGRRVATLEPHRNGASVEWRADLARIGPQTQVLFARPRAPGAAIARIIWLP